jgi:hypothetical protein
MQFLPIWGDEGATRFCEGLFHFPGISGAQELG